MTEKIVYAILLPCPGLENGVFCVCRAETPEGAAAVVEHLLKSGDKLVQMITVKAEVRIE